MFEDIACKIASAINDVINDEAAVDNAFAIAEWKTAWSDQMIDTLYKTCEKKKYTEITKDMCRDKCLFKDFLAKL